MQVEVIASQSSVVFRHSVYWLILYSTVVQWPATSRTAVNCICSIRENVAIIISRTIGPRLIALRESFACAFWRRTHLPAWAYDWRDVRCNRQVTLILHCTSSNNTGKITHALLLRRRFYRVAVNSCDLWSELTGWEWVQHAVYICCVYTKWPRPVCKTPDKIKTIHAVFMVTHLHKSCRQARRAGCGDVVISADLSSLSFDVTLL